jgi:hypothetical protein
VLLTLQGKFWWNATPNSGTAKLLAILYIFFFINTGTVMSHSVSSFIVAFIVTRENVFFCFNICSNENSIG